MTLQDVAPSRRARAFRAGLNPGTFMAVSASLLAALGFAGLPPAVLSLLTLGIIFGIAVMSLDYIHSYGGMMSFGHAALFGTGGYVAGLVLKHVGVDLFVGLPAAALLAGLTGALWGVMLGRLEGVAFAMGTLALGSSIRFLFIQWRDVTGGTDGLVALPLATVFDYPLLPEAIHFLSLAIAVAVFLAFRLLAGTRYGLAFQAVRDNPLRAEAAGVNIYLHRILGMAIGGAVAGIAGALLVYLQGAIDPSQLNWPLSGAFMIHMFLGGPQTLVGPFLAAIGMTLLHYWLSAVTHNWELILGIFVVGFVYLAPRGIGPAVRELFDRSQRREGR